MGMVCDNESGGGRRRVVEEEVGWEGGWRKGGRR